MNEQAIDEGRLAAEADAAVADVVPPEAPPAGAGQVAPADSMVPVVLSAMPVVALVFLPQWELTREECAQLGQALGECLDQVFPGGLDGKYGCWVRLVVAAGGITAGRAMQHGKLPGFGPRRPEKSPAPGGASGASGAGDAGTGAEAIAH